MKTFAEFANTDATIKETGFPTFSQVTESIEGKCMSETMEKKIEEMCEALCEDMKVCHEDDSEKKAEDYLKECMESLKVMGEKLTQQCESYMSALH